MVLGGGGEKNFAVVLHVVTLLAAFGVGDASRDGKTLWDELLGDTLDCVLLRLFDEAQELVGIELFGRFFHYFMTPGRVAGQFFSLLLLYVTKPDRVRVPTHLMIIGRYYL